MHFNNRMSLSTIQRKKSGGSFGCFSRISPWEYEKYSLVEIRENHPKISSHLFSSTLRTGSFFDIKYILTLNYYKQVDIIIDTMTAITNENQPTLKTKQQLEQDYIKYSLRFVAMLVASAVLSVLSVIFPPLAVLTPTAIGLTVASATALIYIRARLSALRRDT